MSGIKFIKKYKFRVSLLYEGQREMLVLCCWIQMVINFVCPTLIFYWFSRSRRNVFLFSSQFEAGIPKKKVTKFFYAFFTFLCAAARLAHSFISQSSASANTFQTFTLPHPSTGIGREVYNYKYANEVS